MTHVFKFLITVLDEYGNFFVFGLMVYTVAAFIALFVIRWKQRATPSIRTQTAYVYIGILSLIGLETARYVWDRTHFEHFPIHVSQICLIVIFRMLGQSAFRLVRERAQWTLLK